MSAIKDKKLKINKILIVNLFFLVASIVYIFAIFSKVPKDSFLLIHDHLTWISPNHLDRESYIVTKINSGVVSPVQLFMSFPNRLIYTLFFSLGIGTRTIQIITFILFLYLLQALSFFGINKLFTCVNDRVPETMDVLITSLIYSFNPFTVIYMNTGNFWSITVVFAYALVPYLIYRICKLFAEKKYETKDIVFLAVLVFIVTYYVPLAIPIGLVVILVILINYGFKGFLQISFKKYVIAVGCLLVMSSCMLLAYSLRATEGYRNVIEVALRDSTAELLDGGVLTMMLNYFGWPIYNPWSPRSIFSYASYFKTPVFLISSLSIYFVIIGWIIRKKKLGKFFISLVLILLASIFFAKGPQEPLGLIYSFLINKVPFFGAVRSPDSKFSVGIVFSISMILMFIMSRLEGLSKRLFQLYVISLILIFSYPLLTGIAILGENIPGKSGDFITKFYPEFREVNDYLNKQSNNYGVLIYPPNSTAVLVHKGKIFIGKDTLSFENTLPFYYLSYGALTEPYVQKILNDIYSNFSLDKLNQVSIKYVIIRQDSYEKEWAAEMSVARKSLSESPGVKKVVDNNFFEVYKLPEGLTKPILSTDCGDDESSISYVSPVEYNIYLSNLSKPCKITLMDLHSKYWNFLLMPSIKSKLPKVLNLKKVSTHYPNEWVIEDSVIRNIPKDYFNESNGGISIRLKLYFMPQLFFNIALGISITSFISCLLFVFIKNRSSGVENSGTYSKRRYNRLENRM